MLFPADLLNHLVQQIRHSVSLLQFHNQIRFANAGQRATQSMRPLHVNLHPAVGVPRQASFEKFRVFDRFGRRNPRQPAHKPLEITRLSQLAIQTRRADFQNVARARNQILDVEQARPIAR